MLHSTPLQLGTSPRVVNDCTRLGRDPTPRENLAYWVHVTEMFLLGLGIGVVLWGAIACWLCRVVLDN